MTIRLVGIVLVVAASKCSAAQAQATPSFGTRAAFQGASPPIAALAMQAKRIRPAEPGTILRPIQRHRPVIAGPGSAADPLPPMPRPISTSPGLLNKDGQSPGAGQAAHASGAVGNDQFMQLANARLAIYDKISGVLQHAPVHGEDLFADSAACAGTAAAAGGVQFDHLAKRWIVTRHTRTTHCIAVSTSADAAGSYWRFALPMAARDGRPVRADDVRLAVWPDAYYMTIALFDDADAYMGPRACGIDRPALLAGRDAAVRCHELGPAYGPLSPAALEGYAIAPEGNSPTTLLALDIHAHGAGQLLMWRFSFSRDTLSAVQPIAVAPFVAACLDALHGACIAQPMPGSPLPALGDRLMPRLTYRNADGIASLVAVHAVQLGTRVGLRWYELRETESGLRVHQHGTHAPDHNSRWMGSIAGDRAGNFALGYQVAGVDTPPGIRYSGRHRSDPHGRMQGEAFVVDGSGVQTGPAPSPALHGAMTVDPIDGCTFYTNQHYAALTGSAAWRTRIASFRFDNCR